MHAGAVCRLPPGSHASEGGLDFWEIALAGGPWDATSSSFEKGHCLEKK